MVQGEGGDCELYHLVKPITFRRSKSIQPDTVPILLQDVNGPCPILAIFNILLLQGKIQLPTHVGEVSQSKVVQMLAEYLLDKNQALEDNISMSESTKANLQYNLADAISLLPRLTTGVDINVRFNDIRGVEFTADVAVFDLLGIDLVHGWLVDPQDVVTTNAIQNKTYNELVCDMITTLGGAPSSAIVSSQHDHGPSSNPDNLPGLIGQSELTRALSSLLHIKTSEEHNVEEVCTTLEKNNELMTTSSLTSQDSVTKAVNSMLHDTVKDVFRTPRDLSRATTIDRNGSNRDSMEKSPILRTLSSSIESNTDLEKIDDKVKAALVAKDFLDTNSSQLTVYGLTSLLEGLSEGQLAVFFRNNHFNVMIKHGHCLYILVTDQGYQSETDVVWEKLTSVAGDTEFVTWDFSSFKPHVDTEKIIPTEVRMNDEQEDVDFRLAMQLQQEEQALALAEQQQHLSRERDRQDCQPNRRKKSICAIM